MTKIILTRINKSSWEFKYNNTYKSFIKETNKALYKLFFDGINSGFDKIPHIWIGKLDFDNKDNKIWVDCTKEIKAQNLLIYGGQYNFN